MAKTMLTILACVGAGSALSACATGHETQVAATGERQGTVKVAYAGAAMVRTTVGETYNGLGGAIRAPFRDFNMMQDKIPVALSKAKGDVYDVTGLDSCEAIAGAIASLDLVLGPDLDTPRVESQRSRSQRLASAAADSAVNAARGALDHYIPVRGVVRQITGARKYEKEVSRANLAGSVRRGFLKAIGMQQNCAWPASPIKFKPKPAMAPVQLASNASLAPAAPQGQVVKVGDAASTAASSTSAAPLSDNVGVIAAARLASTFKPVQVATAQSAPLAALSPSPVITLPTGPAPSGAETLVADHGAAPVGRSALSLAGGASQLSAPGPR